MEKCCGVHEPNISPWRRSVCGDLTSTLDFSAAAHGTGLPKLPTTNDFLERIARSEAGSANTIPPIQAPTAQMPGQRPHRPLPYNLDVMGTVTPERRLRIEMINRGSTGAVITAHDNLDLQEPWHYTIGAGDRIVNEQWRDDDDAPIDAYDLTLRGPNGFWQRYAGSLAADAPRAEVLLVAHPDTGSAEVVLRNEGPEPLVFNIALDEHYPTNGSRSRTVRLKPGTEVREPWSLSQSDHWFDLSVTLVGVPKFVRRFAGKVETGKPGRTDPGIGAMRMTV
jgi:phospholipase C